MGGKHQRLLKNEALREFALRTARPLLRATALVVTIVVTIGIVARYTDLIDRYFVFFPDREVFQDPGDSGLDFEDVFFTAADGVRLHGWFVPGRDETTLVWFHGNAGNIAHRVDNVAELHAKLGVSVFIFDYRGYGKSEGEVSEHGTYLDAEAALVYVRSRDGVAEDRLVLFGRSLGCAVAVETATRSEVYAVVLESPFTSLRAMARRHYPLLSPISLLIKTKYDCLAKIADIDAPLMVLHGDRDEVVPYEMGREIFEAANPPKRFYAIEGAGHNDTYLVGGAAYYDALASFLQDPTRQE